MRRVIPLVVVLIAACAGPFLAPAAQGKSLQITITSPLDAAQVPLRQAVNVEGWISQDRVTGAEAEAHALVWLTVEVRKDDWPDFVKVATDPDNPIELPAPGGQSARSRRWSGGLIAVWATGEQITHGGQTEPLVAGKYVLRVVAVVREGERKGTYYSQQVSVELTDTGQRPDITPCPLAIRVLEAPPYTAGTPYTFLIETPANLGGCFETYDWNYGDGSTSAATGPHEYAKSGTYLVKLTAWADVERKTPSEAGVTATLTVLVGAAPPPVTVTRRVAGFPLCFCSDAKTVLVTKSSEVPTWVPETQVQLVVQINAPSGTFVLREEIPAGWTMTVSKEQQQGMLTRQVEVGGVTQREWLLRGTASTITIVYTLAPGDSAQPKSYPLRGQVTTDSSGGAVDIAGDSEITLVSTLLVEVALAHLVRNGGNAPTDLSLPGSVSLVMKPLVAGYKITPEQVQLAEDYWEDDAIVPFTGGQKVSSEILLKFISWLTVGVPR